MTNTTAASAIAVPRWREWLDLATGGSSVARLLTIAVQLGLLLMLLRLFEVEPASGLLRILPLVFAGFLIHAALPMAWRLPFFLLLSFGAIGIVLGPVPGALLVAIGLIMIGICHLPVAFSTRVLLLILFAGALAALRTGAIAAPDLLTARLAATEIQRVVLPVLASMFMFRVMIYLYDLRQEERAAARGGPSPAGAKPTSIWARLSYFFLLPNVCFLLFPIVDYRTYRRTYYDAKPYDIYQRGVGWIALGVMHLLLYRLIYHYLVPSPEEVQALGGVVRFIIASYLVYFRVVGQFHLIVGLLCLFGFNLPPAHHYFLLASSFTDFWRRARIEWKDFMVKVFFYPALVPLQRKWGPTLALIVSTIFVFAITTLLHSYQWFWLRGDWRLSRTDGVFWVIIGSCVLVNSLLEARRGRSARPKGAAQWVMGPAVLHAFKVVGMFVFMCVLWSYWSSPSFGIWLSYLSAARESGPASYAILVAGLLGLVAAGVWIQFMVARQAVPARAPAAPRGARPSTGFAWQPAIVLASAVLLLLVKLPATRTAFGTGPADVVATLSSNELNDVDQEREDRGYYEVLLDEPRSTAAWLAANDPNAGVAETTPETTQAAGDEGIEPADIEAAAPLDSLTGAAAGEKSGLATPTSTKGSQSSESAPIKDTAATVRENKGAIADSAAAGPAASVAARRGERRLRDYERMTNDMSLWTNASNYRGTFRDAEIHTNQWGMRDKDYTLARPPATYRIALIGSSITVGAGVTVNQTMEAMLEDRLNREGPGAPRRKYEILNFSVGAYGILQNVSIVDQTVFKFKPNALAVGIFSVDVVRMTSYLMKLVRAEVPIPYPHLVEKLRESGATSKMENPELRRRLDPLSADLVRWSYQRIVEAGRQRGVTVVGLVLPEAKQRSGGGDLDQVVRLATAAGMPLLDLRGVYDGQPMDSLWFSESGDPHWNARGHKLVAERLWEELRKHDARTLKLGFPKAPEPDDEASAVQERGVAVLNRAWVRPTGDFLDFELLPSFKTTYKGRFPFQTNRWGMRDKEYSLARPARAHRIALLGSSVEMGAGVMVEQNFETLLEKRLNLEGPGVPGRTYEILNFSVGSYSVLQNIVVAERKLARFSPHAILLTIHSIEPRQTMRHLLNALKSNTAIPYPYLQEKLKETGAKAGMAEPELRRRLQPALDDILRWSYQRFVEIGREQGVPVIGILVPRADLPKDESEQLAKQLKMATESGLPVLSLEGAYNGEAVLIEPFDAHPNARGHQLLADRLYQQLRVNDARTLKLGFAK